MVEVAPIDHKLSTWKVLSEVPRNPDCMVTGLIHKCLKVLNVHSVALYYSKPAQVTSLKDSVSENRRYLTGESVHI